MATIHKNMKYTKKYTKVYKSLKTYKDLAVRFQSNATVSLFVHYP